MHVPSISSNPVKFQGLTVMKIMTSVLRDVTPCSPEGVWILYPRKEQSSDLLASPWYKFTNPKHTVVDKIRGKKYQIERQTIYPVQLNSIFHYEMYLESR